MHESERQSIIPVKTIGIKLLTTPNILKYFPDNTMCKCSHLAFVIIDIEVHQYLSIFKNKGYIYFKLWRPKEKYFPIENPHNMVWK